MTQQDFLNIAQLNPSTLNVWYTDTNVVLGLTIPVLTIASPPDNILEILQQVRTITLPLNATSSVVLTVLTRSIQAVSVGGAVVQYYFFTVTPASTGGADTIISNGQIILEPGYSGVAFLASPYNVLGGSIEDQRVSNYIMKSEENNRSKQYPLLPGNINALQSNTAERSNTQDSNYDLTGWSNARYDGTKTDRYNYGTVEPAMTGKTFNGSYFANNVANGTIQTQSVADLVFENYFYSSQQDVPTPTLRFTGFSLYTSINESATEVKMVTNTQFTGSYQINPGDLLVIGDTAAPGAYGYTNNYEVMQIVSVTPEAIIVPTQFILTLQVKRGWNGTTTTFYSDGNNIMKVDPTRIFKLYGSRVEVAEGGKYRVKDTGQILYVDKLGVLMQSSVGIKRL